MNPRFEPFGNVRERHDDDDDCLKTKKTVILSSGSGGIRKRPKLGAFVSLSLSLSLRLSLSRSLFACTNAHVSEAMRPMHSPHKNERSASPPGRLVRPPQERRGSVDHDHERASVIYLRSSAKDLLRVRQRTHVIHRLEVSRGRERVERMFAPRNERGEIERRETEVVKSWEAESWDHKRREDSRGVFIERSRRAEMRACV